MTDEKTAIIPAGTIFTVTLGNFYDLINCGVFRALQDVDPADLKFRWLSVRIEVEHPFDDDDTAVGRSENDEDKFFGWACRQGVFEPVPAMEWNLGNPSISDETMTVTTPNADPTRLQYATRRDLGLKS